MVKGPGRVILASLARCWRAGTACRAARPARCAGSCRRPAAPASGCRVRLTISAGILVVDPFERRREAVGVALAPHLAVGDDVDAGPFHVADGQQGGIVLRLLAGTGPARATAPWSACAARPCISICAIHQPVGLRVGSDDGGLQQGLGHEVIAP